MLRANKIAVIKGMVLTGAFLNACVALANMPIPVASRIICYIGLLLLYWGLFILWLID